MRDYEKYNTRKDLDFYNSTWEDRNGRLYDKYDTPVFYGEVRYY